MRPICSIVMPTRNCLAYLPKAFESIRLQQVEGLEVLVVDDGSTDGTDAFLAQEAGRWPGLRVLSTDGIGPARARNHAIAVAEGELIAFLDADDVWLDDKLARQLAFHAANPDVALTGTDYRFVNEAGQAFGTFFDLVKPDEFFFGAPAFQRLADPCAALLGCNLIGTSTAVARTAALRDVEGFPTDVPSASDWALWLKIADRHPVAVSGATLVDYLDRPGSVSKNVAARIAALHAIVDAYADRASPAMVRSIRRARTQITLVEAEADLAAGRAWASLVGRLRAFADEPSPEIVRGIAASLLAGIGARSV
ncbi:glycosyltransferase family 2 protein [Roseixanthobacter liquoris]|uniref:glycosyltransferase family 2 protein n=1 Tax=Roseixanthobacter liquoris TaxID=3119921 RepID=UPI003727F209